MKTFAILALTMALTAAAQGQEGRTDPARSGPAVSGFGEFWSIDDAAEAGDPRDGVRAVFDIAIGSEDPSEINRRIDTVARFLNMHLASGFPKDGVKAALVLHGTAARDALDNAGFEKRFGVANPNLPLLAALESAGVEIYLCGQSAASRGFAREEIAPSVDVALSAMTVLLQKQAQGYGLIAF